MTDRAVSTVLDAGLFLLLASVAVGVLVGATGEPPAADGDGDVASPTATTLGSATATVRYQPAGTAPVHTDRGTVAGLLARAALANATLDGAALAVEDAYVRAVGNETATVLDGIHGDVRVHVHARWRPLPGTDLAGEADAGPTPPARPDVHAATLAVPTGGTDRTTTGERDAEGRRDGATGRQSLEVVADESGCPGLGRAIARRVVAALFPPERTAVALRQPDVGSRVEARYRSAGTAAGVDADQLLVGGVVARNDALAEALAPELERACREHDSPASAARSAAPGQVTVVVRTWSP